MSLHFGSITDWPSEPSLVQHHRAICCATASARLMSRLTHHPSWRDAISDVPNVVEWKPIAWPAYWCDLVHGDKFRGDCGVHAFLVARLLARVGVRHSRGRAAIASPKGMAEHWSALWRSSGLVANWIAGNLCYHEVILVDERRWWDPTEARWFDGTGSRLESGTVVALSADWQRWVWPNGELAKPDLRSMFR